MRRSISFRSAIGPQKPAPLLLIALHRGCGCSDFGLFRSSTPGADDRLPWFNLTFRDLALHPGGPGGKCKCFSRPRMPFDNDFLPGSG